MQHSVNVTTLDIRVEDIHEVLLQSCVSLKKLKSLTFLWRGVQPGGRPLLRRATYTAMDSGAFPHLDSLRVDMASPWNSGLGRLIEYQSSTLRTLAFISTEPFGISQEDSDRSGRELLSLVFARLRHITLFDAVCPLSFAVALISRHQQTLLEVNMTLANACSQKYVHWSALVSLMTGQWDNASGNTPFEQSGEVNQEGQGSFIIGSFAFARSQQGSVASCLKAVRRPEEGVAELALQISNMHLKNSGTQTAVLNAMLSPFVNLESLRLYCKEGECTSQALVSMPILRTGRCAFTTDSVFFFPENHISRHIVSSKAPSTFGCRRDRHLDTSSLHHCRVISVPRTR